MKVYKINKIIIHQWIRSKNFIMQQISTFKMIVEFKAIELKNWASCVVTYKLAKINSIKTND